MTEVERLADFVVSARFEHISKEAVAQLKIRILDSLGCAIGALDSEPTRLVRELVTEFGGSPLAVLIGGGASAPDRATFYNGALVRYLDFMDSYLAKGETNHPSDNLAPVLAAAEYADGSGKDLLTALAVAYQVHIRLSDVAPVRARGFDHTTQGAYAVAAGVAKALGLDRDRTANAIAISGTANNALRVTRTGRLSHWKGLAYPNTAFSACHATFLAARGITGPIEVFEGNKGFKQTIAGPFEIDWKAEDLEGVRRTIVKKYNAEIHAQSAVDAVLELRRRHGFTGAEVERVEIDIFDVAFDIIGGGEEGEKTEIRTKEEADHSLPYMIAVALLDGELMPAQYTPERIGKDDVQRLLRRVIIRPNASFTERFPREMPVRLAVTLLDGRRFEMEQSDYEGFHSRPLPWEGAVAKFHRLSAPHCGRQSRDAIVQAVRDIESRNIRALTRLLSALHAGDRDMNDERAFSFIPLNAREAKPRRRGITEIRGPYYSVMGERYLTDVLETMGWYVDGLKFAGGSFALMPRQRVKAIIDLAHAHDVYVSTGGWMEHVLTRGREAVEAYVRECSELGFDVVELSTGFISLPADDLVRLVKKVAEAGLKAKPELGIQFGAGGDTPAEVLQAEGTRDVQWVIDQANRCLDAGASIIMIESEGITENVVSWRTDAVARIINAVGLEKTMFEAADPRVFEWYVKNYGVHVNLFVDHSQIVQLECLRSGIWGTKSTWGRVLAFGG